MARPCVYLKPGYANRRARRSRAAQPRDAIPNPKPTHDAIPTGSRFGLHRAAPPRSSAVSRMGIGLELAPLRLRRARRMAHGLGLHRAALPRSSVPSDHYRWGLVLLVTGRQALLRLNDGARVPLIQTRLIRAPVLACVLLNSPCSPQPYAPTLEVSVRWAHATERRGMHCGGGMCGGRWPNGLGDICVGRGVGETDSSVLTLLADLSQCTRTRLGEEERPFQCRDSSCRQGQGGSSFSVKKTCG